MEIKTERGAKYKDVKWIKIRIGQTDFVFAETIDGHLEINKHSDSAQNRLLIKPVASNEIEVF